MNDIPANANLPAVQKRQFVQVHDDSNPLFDTAQFEHMTRVAALMASAPLVPMHLREGSVSEAQANCFLIVNQARKWKMDPFALAQGTYIRQGKLGYEGKVIAAAIEALLGPILEFEYFGDPGTDKRGIRVFGIPPGRATEKEIRGTVGEWKTYEKGGAVNESWKKAAQADLMLVYRGFRTWCRVYTSWIILGVYAPDELDEIAAGGDPTPPPISASPVSRRRIRDEQIEGKAVDTKTEPAKADAVATKVEPEPAKTEPAKAESTKPVETFPARQDAKAEPAKPATRARQTRQQDEPNPAAPVGELGLSGGSTDSGPARLMDEGRGGPGVTDVLAALKSDLSMCLTPEDVVEVYKDLDPEAELTRFNVPGAVEAARKIKDDRIIALMPEADGGKEVEKQVGEHKAQAKSDGDVYMQDAYNRLDACRTAEDVTKLRMWWAETRANRKNYGISPDVSAAFGERVSTTEIAIKRG